MRTVSLVDRIKWELHDSVNPRAIAVGDITNDQCNELVVGTTGGRLLVFRGQGRSHAAPGAASQPELLKHESGPWTFYVNLGVLNCVAIGDIRGQGRNSVICINTNGDFYIFDYPWKPIQPAHIFRKLSKDHTNLHRGAVWATDSITLQTPGWQSTLPTVPPPPKPSTGSTPVLPQTVNANLLHQEALFHLQTLPSDEPTDASPFPVDQASQGSRRGLMHKHSFDEPGAARSKTLSEQPPPQTVVSPASTKGKGLETASPTTLSPPASAKPGKLDDSLISWLRQKSSGKLPATRSPRTPLSPITEGAAQTHSPVPLNHEGGTMSRPPLTSSGFRASSNVPSLESHHQIYQYSSKFFLSINSDQLLIADFDQCGQNEIILAGPGNSLYAYSVFSETEDAHDGSTYQCTDPNCKAHHKLARPFIYESQSTASSTPAATSSNTANNSPSQTHSAASTHYTPPTQQGKQPAFFTSPGPAIDPNVPYAHERAAKHYSARPHTQLYPYYYKQFNNYKEISAVQPSFRRLRTFTPVGKSSSTQADLESATAVGSMPNDCKASAPGRESGGSSVVTKGSGQASRPSGSRLSVSSTNGPPKEAESVGDAGRAAGKAIKDPAKSTAPRVLHFPSRFTGMPGIRDFIPTKGKAAGLSNGKGPLVPQAQPNNSCRHSDRLYLKMRWSFDKKIASLSFIPLHPVLKESLLVVCHPGGSTTFINRLGAKLFTIDPPAALPLPSPRYASTNPSYANSPANSSVRASPLIREKPLLRYPGRLSGRSSPNRSPLRHAHSPGQQIPELQLDASPHPSLSRRTTAPSADEKEVEGANHTGEIRKSPRISDPRSVEDAHQHTDSPRKESTDKAEYLGHELRARASAEVLAGVQCSPLHPNSIAVVRMDGLVILIDPQKYDFTSLPDYNPLLLHTGWPILSRSSMLHDQYIALKQDAQLGQTPDSTAPTAGAGAANPRTSALSGQGASDNHTATATTIPAPWAHPPTTPLHSEKHRHSGTVTAVLDPRLHPAAYSQWPSNLPGPPFDLSMVGEINPSGSHDSHSPIHYISHRNLPTPQPLATASPHSHPRVVPLHWRGEGDPPLEPNEYIFSLHLVELPADNMTHALNAVLQQGGGRRAIPSASEPRGRRPRATGHVAQNALITTQIPGDEPSSSGTGFRRMVIPRNFAYRVVDTGPEGNVTNTTEAEPSSSRLARKSSNVSQTARHLEAIRDQSELSRATQPTYTKSPSLSFTQVLPTDDIPASVPIHHDGLPFQSGPRNGVTTSATQYHTTPHSIRSAADNISMTDSTGRGPSTRPGSRNSLFEPVTDHRTEGPLVSSTAPKRIRTYTNLLNVRGGDEGSTAAGGDRRTFSSFAPATFTDTSGLHALAGSGAAWGSVATPVATPVMVAGMTSRQSSGTYSQLFTPSESRAVSNHQSPLGGESNHAAPTTTIADTISGAPTPSLASASGPIPPSSMLRRQSVDSGALWSRGGRSHITSAPDYTMPPIAPVRAISDNVVPLLSGVLPPQPHSASPLTNPPRLHSHHTWSGATSRRKALTLSHASGSPSQASTPSTTAATTGALVHRTLPSFVALGGPGSLPHFGSPLPFPTLGISASLSTPGTQASAQQTLGLTTTSRPFKASPSVAEAPAEVNAVHVSAHSSAFRQHSGWHLSPSHARSLSSTAGGGGQESSSTTPALGARAHHSTRYATVPSGLDSYASSLNSPLLVASPAMSALGLLPNESPGAPSAMSSSMLEIPAHQPLGSGYPLSLVASSDSIAAEAAKWSNSELGVSSLSAPQLPMVQATSRQMLVMSAWNGTTTLVDPQTREAIQFQFPRHIRAFAAGMYALEKGRNVPCLFYVDYNESIYVYYNIAVGLNRVPTLPEIMEPLDLPTNLSTPAATTGSTNHTGIVNPSMLAHAILTQNSPLGRSLPARSADELPRASQPASNQGSPRAHRSTPPSLPPIDTSVSRTSQPGNRGMAKLPGRNASGDAMPPWHTNTAHVPTPQFAQMAKLIYDCLH
ncbi:hypothetical protein H4R34_001776 [Dimargaris verticillata]|uniref:Uncharacterized protein n=1 Tax=Dimargaris verticillata TaxID=2761393 RepID=A0A9W8BA33_9FUNG|nr:hypothetical protein H4R34_001776 [Dimargaris verticillata]